MLVQLQPTNALERSRGGTFLLRGISLFAFAILTHFSFAQSEARFEWEKYYGPGTFNSFIELEDGYILGGNSSVGAEFPKTSPGKGGQDYWVIRTDKNGNKIWDKTFGGVYYENLTTMIKTKDNNIVLIGTSNSGIGGDKTAESRGGDDFWIVKVSPKGEKIWDRTFGGSNNEICKGGVEIEGGYAVAGTSNSPASGDKTENSLGEYGQGDFWVVKFDDGGNKVFDKVYGTEDSDYLASIVKTTDGGFILGGTNSTAWFLRATSKGEILWAHYHSETESDQVGKIVQTAPGEYLVLGTGVFNFDEWQGYYIGGMTMFEDGTMYLSWYVENFVGYELCGDENSYFLWYQSEDGSLGWSKSGASGYWYKNLQADFLKTTNSGEDFAIFGSTVKKLQSDLQPTSRFFYTGVDLNSKTPNTLIKPSPYFTGDSHYLQGEKCLPYFSARGRRLSNSALPVNGTVDAETANMLRSSIEGTKQQPASFNFYKVEPGEYEVYLYNWEDNKTSTFSINIQGKTVLKDYSSGDKGNWAKLGPFKVTSSNGRIHISTSGGEANISGIELWKVVDGVLERALDLNSSTGITIDKEVFEGSKTATGFTFTGKLLENQSVALTPKTDDQTAKMVRSSISSTKKLPATLNITTQTSETYNVYLYLWEDNKISNFTLKINGKACYRGRTGRKGEWQLLGPFQVVAAENKIVVTASGGEANLSGVKIYKMNAAATPSNLRLAEEEEEEIAVETEEVKAFPNPLGEKLTVLLSKEFEGATSVSLTDLRGNTLMTSSRELKFQKEMSLNVPSLAPGLYFLRINYGSRSVVKRLYKR